MAKDTSPVPPVKKLKKKVKLPKNARVEIGKLLLSSIRILTEPCRACDVDYDQKTEKYIVDPAKPLQFACLVGFHPTEGLKPKEVYVANVTELQPTTTTVLSFEEEEDRVSYLHFFMYKCQRLFFTAFSFLELILLMHFK